MFGYSIHVVSVVADKKSNTARKCNWYKTRKYSSDRTVFTKLKRFWDLLL